MFSKDGILYSEAFKYLYNPKMNAVAFQFAEGGGWEERELPQDFDIEIHVETDESGTVTGHRALFCNRLFAAVLPADLSYGSVKTAMIQKRFSMDAQMAIILNKDDSEEKAELYQKMQEWRSFAAYFARRVSAMQGQQRLG